MLLQIYPLSLSCLDHSCIQAANSSTDLEFTASWVIELLAMITRYTNVRHEKKSGRAMFEMTTGGQNLRVKEYTLY